VNSLSLVVKNQNPKTEIKERYEIRQTLQTETNKEQLMVCCGRNNKKRNPAGLVLQTPKSIYGMMEVIPSCYVASVKSYVQHQFSIYQFKSVLDG